MEEIMNCNLKVLGLALVAVLAMSAMVASAAGASSFIASNGKGTRINAYDSGSIKYTVTGQEVICKDAFYTGSAPGFSFTSIEVYAAFNQCSTNFGEATVTGFSLNEALTVCRFVLYASGTADLVCPEGKDVTVDALTCTVHISAQKGLGTLTYTNDISGDVRISLNVTKITGNHTDGFLCPFGSSGSSSEGVLETGAFEQPLTATANVGTLKWEK